MDPLRSAILLSRALDAQHLVDERLAQGATTQEILASLYVCAAHHVDFTSSIGALALVHSLERVVPDLERLRMFPEIGRSVARFLAAMPKADPAALEPPRTLAPCPDLRGAIAEGNAEQVASHLVTIETPEGAANVRRALRALAVERAGARGRVLIFVNALLHGLERVAAPDRGILARHAARFLAASSRDAGERVAAREGSPPIPGSSSAAGLLDALQKFNAPAAHAALDALLSSAREREALAALLERSCENSGRERENLLLACAAAEMMRGLPQEKQRLLLDHVLRGLLRRESDEPLLEGLANSVPEKTPGRIRQEDLEQRLQDALSRCDARAAVECARPLLHDAAAADRVRRALFRVVAVLPDPEPPRALAVTAACLAAARFLEPPAAHGALLRAVCAVAGERFA
ncbi:MAG: hypothetical protein HY812_13225 [Planctomycetes bacterium]|nr:hypothetical protein [Planctomycetota bacterium]